MRNQISFGGKRRQILLLVLSVIYAVCLVWGRDIMIADTVKYRSAEVLFRILFYLVLIYIILNIIFIMINLIEYKITSAPPPTHSIASSYIKMSGRKMFFCVLTSIVVCWLPTYIVCFPGLGIYDGPTQLITLSTHHPVMHTLLIHFCGALADWIGWSSWLFPYAIIQSLFLASAFSYLLVTLNRWKVPKIVIVLVDIWFCVFPMHALMALASTKDSIFAGFFVLFVCKLGDLLLSDTSTLPRNWYIKYWLICFMLCAFRNNGVYVLLCTIPFMLFMSNSKKIILISLTVVITYTIFQGPVMNILHVEQGDKREAMSIIIQPFSRIYNEKGGELSEEELNAISHLFGDHSPWYVSHISDAAKSQFDSAAFFESLENYTKLYIKLGLRYPRTYLDAFLANTYGNWYPHEILPDPVGFEQYPNALRRYFEFPGKSAEEYGSIWPSYYNFLYDLTRESSYLRIPMLYLIFCTGIVFWGILFLLVCAIERRAYKKIVLFIPFLALWATIMLGPVALFRYTYPLMVGLPLLACFTFKNQ